MKLIKAMEIARQREGDMNRCLRAILYKDHGDVNQICEEVGIPLSEVWREHDRIAAYHGCKGANFPFPMPEGMRN